MLSLCFLYFPFILRNWCKQNLPFNGQRWRDFLQYNEYKKTVKLTVFNTIPAHTGTHRNTHINSYILIYICRYLLLVYKYDTNSRANFNNESVANLGVKWLDIKNNCCCGKENLIFHIVSSSKTIFNLKLLNLLWLKQNVMNCGKHNIKIINHNLILDNQITVVTSLCKAIICLPESIIWLQGQWSENI